MTPEQAELYARTLEAAARRISTQLEKMRDDVTGNPDGLVRVADGYLADADRTQRTFELLGVHTRVLSENWRGWAHDDWQETAKPVRASVGAVVRNLRAERGWLLLVAEALRTARTKISAVVESFAAQAQGIANEARSGQFEARALNEKWVRLVNESGAAAERAQRELGDLLGRTEQHATETWWRRNMGKWLEEKLAGEIKNTTPRPTAGPGPQGLDAQGTEFSESVQSLVGRMNLDTTSPTANQLRNTPYLQRFDDWKRLVGPGGQWDLKVYYDRMWGMPERNNFYIPLPADVGTIGGRQVEIDRDLLGNIHYGYTSASISGWGGTARFGADAYDWLFHGRSDEGDQIGMAIGADLHQRFPSGTQLTPQFVGGLNQAVVDALRTNFDELVRTGKIRVR